MRKLQSKKRQAFEVENVQTRENFTQVYEPELKEIQFFNTSRGVGKKLELVYREKDGDLIPTFCKDFVLGEMAPNPLGCKTAYTYFTALYEKSLNIVKSHPIVFLGWVDPDTIEPLDEIEGAEKW